MHQTHRAGLFSRRRLARLLLAVFALTIVLQPAPPTWAQASGNGGASYFGDANFPPGCETDHVRNGVRADYWRTDIAGTKCHHMRSDMNGLDSPEVDVLILLPASPRAERDARMMRQAIEMWEQGIDHVALQMGMGWLANGMNFHVTVDHVDLTGDSGGEFTTYPVVDPEIVVIATNEVGGIGIGIDPVDFVFTNENLVPCHGVKNPFDFEYWENLPGFDRHHEERSGTYVEDCGGAGGNICFAINGAAEMTLDFGLFDLVAHEVGHCLTIGHVGDGAEGKWGGLPPDDIMAYAAGVPGTKCVSSLNVLGIAARMSKYLDVNGDRVVNAADRLKENDARGDLRNPFVTQHPSDHFYASSTGRAAECPQPDGGLVPGPRVSFTPGEYEGGRELVITGPASGTENQSGEFLVTGTVTKAGPPPPPSKVVTADPAGDSISPTADWRELFVEVTDTAVVARAQLSALASPGDAHVTRYRFVVGNAWFDTSLVAGKWQTTYRDGSGGATGSGVVVPEATAVVDEAARTITWTVQRSFLTTKGVKAPYEVAAWTYSGGPVVLRDDLVPNTGTATVHAPAAQSARFEVPLTGPRLSTTTFQHEGPLGNTFYPEQSTFGVTPFADGVLETGLLDQTHLFDLPLGRTSDVTFTLTWTDAVGGADLDLYVTGAGVDSGITGATGTNPLAAPGTAREVVTLAGVSGPLRVAVEPYFVTDPLSGSTYTLTAKVVTAGLDTDGDGVEDHVDACPTVPGTAANGCPDRDGDGVDDSRDVCPNLYGEGADGCPVEAVERVEVRLGSTRIGVNAVDTATGPDAFAIPVSVDEGVHELRIDWVANGRVVATGTLIVVHDVDDDDDGVPNAADVCPGHDDALDADGDGIPDGCDPVDGSGDGGTGGTGGAGPTGTGGGTGLADGDGDGVADDVDNCPTRANADQADLDGDGRGDACDNDIDGDGHANGKERAHGTDPYDPTSYPTKGGKKA